MREYDEVRLRAQNLFVACTFKILFHMFLTKLLPKEEFMDKTEFFLVIASQLSRRYKITAVTASTVTGLLGKCIEQCRFITVEQYIGCM